MQLAFYVQGPLRWEDVDLQAAVLRVSQTLTRDGGKVSVGPPKTKNSRRTVGGSRTAPWRPSEDT